MTLVLSDGFESVIPALDVNVGLGDGQKRVGLTLDEDTHAADAFEGGQDDGPVQFGIDGPSGTFEFTHRCVSIQADEQSIPQAACSLKVGHVAGVKQVETAIRDDQCLAAGTHLCPPTRQILPRNNFFARTHADILA